MSHVDFDRIFDLIGGSGTAEETSHLEDCEACRNHFELWRVRLADLREIESNPVDAAEMHNLRVLYRELGPSSDTQNWVARLVRSSEPAAAEAVRGGLAATFSAYQAGPYQIVVQIRPSEAEGRFDIQGQVAGDERRGSTPTRVVLTSAGGFADLAAVDSYGEFRMTGVPRGPCRLVWYGEGARIDLESLTFGVGDGDNRD